MKRLVIVLTVFAVIGPLAGNAAADCRCKLPAYKDHLDFLIQYSECLEECFNAKVDRLASSLDLYEKRIERLEAEVNRLRIQIEDLEASAK